MNQFRIEAEIKREAFVCSVTIYGTRKAKHITFSWNGIWQRSLLFRFLIRGFETNFGHFNKDNFLFEGTAFSVTLDKQANGLSVKLFLH